MVQRVDYLIGGVLAVALIGSVVGGMVYEDAAPPTAFSVAWEVGAENQNLEGQTREGAGSMTIEHELPMANLTQAVFTVTVTGDGPRINPKQVTIEVSHPNVTAAQAMRTLPGATTGATTVSAEFTLNLAPVPNVTVVHAHSLREAQEDVAAEHTSTRWQGTWTIRITITGSDPVGTETIRAGGTVEVQTYQARVAAQTPDIEF